MSEIPRRRRLSPLVERVAGEGAAAWQLHSRAIRDRRAGQDVIVLSVGDPDFDTPPAIVDAAVSALRGGDTHYTAQNGYAELREAIALRHGQRLGEELDPECVVVCAGTQNALFASSLCLLAPGDEVIVPTPMYVTYEATVQVSGAQLVPVHASPESGFRPAPGALEAAVTSATRAIFLANPNNPTGVALTREELAGIADIACRHDLWVVCDEVYAELVFQREHVPMAALPGMGPRTLTLGSLSKSHAMTGWRCGWTIAPPELVPHLVNLAQCMLYGLPGFIQRGAVEALTGSHGEAATMTREYQRRRDRLVAALSSIPGLSPLVPEAGMFVLLDIRATGLTSSRFACALYNHAGVSVLDATPFGADGFVRVSFSPGEAELDEACRRIAGFARALPLRRRAAPA